MAESETDIKEQTSQYLSEGSALLSRVASFLPKLKQANETLQETGPNEKIDFDLENHDENESVDDDDSTESNEVDASSLQKGQVIEMNIAMGDVSKDPVFHMLGDDANNDSNASDSGESQQSTGTSENAVQNLLNRKRTGSPGLSESKQPKKESSPLIKVIHESNNPTE